MKHLIAVAIVSVLVAACGTTDDDRPRTIEYVVEAITRPHCANAQCHSAFVAAGPTFPDGTKVSYSFDSVENAQISFNGIVAPGDSGASLLYQVLIRSADADGNFPRMPYDEPLPDPDKELIKRWIDEGADGFTGNP
jgi:hypothetical protein